VSNLQRFAGRVAAVRATGRVPVPDPARQPTAPQSLTIARDGMWSSAVLTHAGECIFMRHHNLWVSASGPRMGLSGVVGPQNGGYAGFCETRLQNPLPRTPVNKPNRRNFREACREVEHTLPVY
jgi:hypothetical protein